MQVGSGSPAIVGAVLNATRFAASGRTDHWAARYKELATVYILKRRFLTRPVFTKKPDI